MSYTQTVTSVARTSVREQVAMTLVNAMKPVYFYLRRNRIPWNVTQQSLLNMPQGTLGNDLARFLQANQLKLMPKAEFHDVYHVLFGFGTTMKEETCIQFVPVGNGRRSLPFIATIMISMIFYPENWPDFYAAYNVGRNANKFHDLDFEPMLHMKTAEVCELIFKR